MRNETPLEEWEQKVLFCWIKSNQIRYPKLQLAYGTLNGVRLSPRLRKKMKEQGNRRGVPDIVLPAWSHDRSYPGLYIELKRVKGGRVSEDQEKYHSLLKHEGYQCLVCRGHIEAIEALKNYIGC